MAKRKIKKGTIIQSMDCTKIYTCLTDLADDGVLLKGEDDTIFLADRADITQVLGYRLDIKESAIPAQDAPYSAPEPPPESTPSSEKKSSSKAKT